MEKELVITGETKHKKKKIRKLFEEAKEEAGVEERMMLEVLEKMMMAIVAFM